MFIVFLIQRLSGRITLTKIKFHVGIISPHFSNQTSVRRIVCIFLLILLPLHSLAMQSGWLSAENQFDVAHEIEHLERTSHHHGDDGAVHYDDSGESAKHFSEHSASQPAMGLPGISLSPVMLEPLSTAPPCVAQYIPDPILKRPQRPPSSLG